MSACEMRHASHANAPCADSSCASDWNQFTIYCRVTIIASVQPVQGEDGNLYCVVWMQALSRGRGQGGWPFAKTADELGHKQHLQWKMMGFSPAPHVPCTGSCGDLNKPPSKKKLKLKIIKSSWTIGFKWPQGSLADGHVCSLSQNMWENKLKHMHVHTFYIHCLHCYIVANL